jgi:hypothetical protein
MNHAKFLRGLVEQKLQLDLESRDRSHHYVFARVIYYKILREETFMTLKQIGQTLGRTHATVINALSKYDSMALYDKRIPEILDEIRYEARKKIVRKNRYIIYATRQKII